MREGEKIGNLDQQIGKKIEATITDKETHEEHCDLCDHKERLCSNLHHEDHKFPPLESPLKAQEIVMVEMGGNSSLGPTINMLKNLGQFGVE